MRLNRYFVAGSITALLWTSAESLGQQGVPTGSQQMVRSPTVMPARFASGLIYVDVAVLSKDTLAFYTDTGGGTFLYGHAVDRVNWNDSTGVSLGDIVIDQTFPEPLGTEGGLLPIFRPEGKGVGHFDGMLGQAWFASRIWTFDYESELLLLHDSAPALDSEERVIELGFKTDSTGARLLSFPRLSVVADGDTLDMLFDTGARVDLTARALSALGDGGSATRATSFITTEVMDGWLSRHPDWPVIQGADDRVEGMRMIEVPSVRIAGVEVGPIRFTERPNTSFQVYMSQFTDRSVDGALGGNAFRFFRVLLDYPAAEARFTPLMPRGRDEDVGAP